MSSDDDIYFDAPEDLDEIRTTVISTPLTPKHECIRNRIESLKKSARKFDRQSHVSPRSRFGSIEFSSAEASISESNHCAPISHNIASSRLLSRTFPEKNSFFSGKGMQDSHRLLDDDLENYSNVRSRTAQPMYFPPVLSPVFFERPSPISSAPEVSLQHNLPCRNSYVKSWSLDAARYQPPLLIQDHEHSLLVLPRVPLPMEPLLDRSEDSDIGLSSLHQSQVDACVQADINTLSRQDVTATTTNTLMPAHKASTMLWAKTAASTLHDPGSSVNPMSLDYRTRTLSASSLQNNDDLDKLSSERNGLHRNLNLISGFRRLNTAFRGAMSAMRSATKAKIFNQDDSSSEEDDEVVGNQGIRLRCSRKIKGHKEFLQIKLVQEMDNEHIGAIWAMRSSPCGRLLATSGYDRNIRIWVLRQWFNNFNDMLQDAVDPTQQGCEASSNLGPTIIDDLDIDSVSITSTSSNGRTDDGSSSCGSSGLLETASVSTRSCDQVPSPNRRILGSKSRRSGASAYYHPHSLLVYRGHDGVITELAWSKNLFLLSTGMDRQVRLWHVSRRECLCVFSHNDTVPAIVFHPKDDRFFLSGSLDGKLRLWNIPDKKVRFWVDVPLPSYLPSPSTASVVATAGGCDVKPKTVITCATFACDSTKVVVGSYDGRVMFFNTELTYITFIAIRSTSGRCPQCRVTAIEVDPTDSNKILVTSNDSRVRLIDARDYHTLCKYRGFLNETSQIRASFSATGRYIISGSENHFFYIWRKQMDFLNISRFSSTRKDRNNCWEAIKAHDAVVTVAIFLPNSDFLLDKRLRRNPSRRRADPRAMKMSSKVAANWGEVIVSADCNGCIKVFKNRAPFSALSSTTHPDF